MAIALFTQLECLEIKNSLILCKTWVEYGREGLHGLGLGLGTQVAGGNSGLTIPAGWPWASCLTFSEAWFPHLQNTNGIFLTLEYY